MRAFASDKSSAPPRTLPPTVPSTVTRCAPVTRLPVTLPRTVTSRPNASKSPLMVPSIDTVWPIASTVSLIVSSAATVTRTARFAGSRTHGRSTAARRRRRAALRLRPRTRGGARPRTASQATNASTSAAPTKFNVAVHIAVPSETMNVTTLDGALEEHARFEWAQPLELARNRRCDACSRSAWLKPPMSSDAEHEHDEVARSRRRHEARYRRRLVGVLAARARSTALSWRSASMRARQAAQSAACRSSSAASRAGKARRRRTSNE